MYDTQKEWDRLNHEEIIVRWALSIIIAISLSVFIGCDGTAAPAPLPKPPPSIRMVPQLTARDLQGAWLLSWGGGIYTMSLFPGGGYVATIGKNGTIWTGTWHIDGNGSLYVSESILDDNGLRGSASSWKVLWDRDKRGKHNASAPSGNAMRPDGSSSTAVSLKRIKK